MTPEVKAAKISRADQFAEKLITINNETELNKWIDNVVYVLISRLDQDGELKFNELLNNANFVVSFQSQVIYLLDILEQYKKYIHEL